MPAQNPNYRSKIYQKQPLGPTNSGGGGGGGGEYERPTFNEESTGFCGCCRKSQPRMNPPQQNWNAQGRRSVVRTKSRNRQTQSRGNVNTGNDDDDEDEDEDENDEEGIDTDENNRRKQSSGAYSTNSRQPRSSIRNLPNQNENQNPSHAGNCCRRCLKCIYQHGSLIGPAAFSFSCCCICCLRSIPRAKFSSYATKIVYLVFLGIVTLFASFFVIDYDDDFFEKDGKGMSGLIPCVDGKKLRYIGGWFEDCTGHSGYFMVYRIFLAAIIIFLFLGIFLIGVGSNQDSCRPGVHQGYWCCKLILFFVLVIVFLTQINVGKEGLFDEIFMYFGLVASLLFSMPQIVILMDLVEFIYIRLRESCPKYFDFFYWPLTVFIYMIDIGFLVVLGFFYTKRSTGEMGDALNYGEGSLCGTNIALIFYSCIVGVVTFSLTLIHGFIKNSFYPNASLIHSAVVWFHTLLYTWNAIGNSPDIECRPVWYPYTESRNSRDVCFTLEGCVHTFSVWFLLIYLAIGDAPKTKAPLSRAAMKICCISPPEKITDDDYDDDQLLEETNKTDSTRPKKPLKPLNQQLSEVVVVKPEDDDEDDDDEIIPKYVMAGGDKKDNDDPEVPSTTAPPPRTSRPRPSNSSSRRSSSRRRRKKSSVLTASEIELRRQRGRFYVQNDESKKLKYSWSLFHGLLIIAALSIMMGMTNFIHPRADGPHSSSYPAFWFKILISPVGVAGYLVPIIVSWACFRIPSSSNLNIGDDDDDNENENDVESTPEPATGEPSQKSLTTKDDVSIEGSTADIMTASEVNNVTTSVIQSSVTKTSKNTTNTNTNTNATTGDNSNKNKQNTTNIKNKTTTTPNDIKNKIQQPTIATTDNDKKLYLIPNKKVGSKEGSNQLNQDETQGKGNDENNKTKRKRIQSNVVVIQPPPKQLGDADFNKF